MRPQQQRTKLALGGPALLLLAGACVPPPAGLSAAPQPDATVTSDTGLAPCGTGLVAVGQACIPQAVACAQDEVPSADGCLPVGVRACPGGLAAPPDWRCQPVGPEPQQCAEGWVRAESEALCEPVLPAERCLGHEREVIGEPTCQPVDDCGTGPYGDRVSGPGTLHVDQSYTGAVSDGSPQHPYRTITEALGVPEASRTTHVLVAAGTYHEALHIQQRSVVIEGRCPQLVRIEAQAPATISVQADRAEVTLRGLEVASVLDCIGAIGGGAILLDRVVVQGCGPPYGHALAAVGTAEGFPEITVRGSVLTGNKGGVGVGVHSAVVIFEESVARRAQWVIHTTIRQAPAHVAMRRSVVQDGDGIIIEGAAAELEYCVVRDSGGLNPAITVVERVWPGQVPPSGGDLKVRGCTIQDNQGGAITVGRHTDFLLDASLLQRNGHPGRVGFWGRTGVITNTLFRNGDGFRCIGLTDLPPRLVVSRTAFVELHDLGVGSTGCVVSVDRSLIGSTLPSQPEFGGVGLLVDNSEAAVRDSIVEDSRLAAILSRSSALTLERSLVRGTAPEEAEGFYGIGVSVETLPASQSTSTQTAAGPSSLRMVDSTIADSAYAGLLVEDGEVELVRSLIRDTREPAPRRWGGPGIVVQRREERGRPNLVLTDSVVARSSDVGVHLEGADATLRGVIVRDTRTKLGDDSGGTAINVRADATGDEPSKVSLRDCWIRGSHDVGLYVRDSQVSVDRSAIVDTTGDALGYGDGAVVVGATARLDLADSLIDGAARAGVLFHAADGSVRRSQITSTRMAVVLDEGATPQLGPRNHLSGNEEDRPVFGQRCPLPPPPVLPPPPRVDEK